MIDTYLGEGSLGVEIAVKQHTHMAGRAGSHVTAADKLSGHCSRPHSLFVAKQLVLSLFATKQLVLSVAKRRPSVQTTLCNALCL